MTQVNENNTIILQESETHVSRRKAISVTAGAIAFTTGLFGDPFHAISQTESQISSTTERMPTSEDAEVILWGRLNGVSDPGSTDREYIYKRLLLQGDWRRTRFTYALAWGNGHDGEDVWASWVPRVRPPHFRELDLGNRRPHYENGCFHFRIGFEKQAEPSSQAKERTTSVSVMFRYVEKKGHDEVHRVSVVAFQFPGT